MSYGLRIEVPFSGEIAKTSKFRLVSDSYHLHTLFRRKAQSTLVLEIF